MAEALQNNPKNDHLIKKQAELHKAIGDIREFIEIRA